MVKLCQHSERRRVIVVSPPLVFRVNQFPNGGQRVIKWKRPQVKARVHVRPHYSPRAQTRVEPWIAEAKDANNPVMCS